MRRTITIALVVLVASVAARGQTPDPSELQNQEAKREINEGALAYRARNYYEAQLHFERAMALDPTFKTSRLFYARAIHAQYKPGDESPDNVAKARAAIAAYQHFLEVEPENDDAYNAVLYLYRAIKEEEQETQWLLGRAADEKAPAQKRAMAYTVLASKDWQCSFNVTEQVENKRTTARAGRIYVTYVMPKDRAQFAKASQCAERGLEYAEKAVSLDPESEQAWVFKTNVLLELTKLAKMEDDSGRALSLQKQADEAQRRVTELNESKKKREEEERKRSDEAQRPPATL